jgi:Arc/MetJ family transcription regulator
MKDPDFEAYVDAIEGHFRARRGVDHILSPRDFALARTWHQAGVPLATVLVGIDRGFDSGEPVTSLSFCRRRVEELLAAGQRPQVRPTPAPERVPLEEVGELLGSLLERLQRLRPGPDACFEPPLGRIQEVRDLLSVASRPNWDFVRRKLREIDDDVSAAALQALSPEERAAFRAEAGRAVERHRGRVDADALEDARQRYLLQRARERLALPRVSLL